MNPDADALRDHFAGQALTGLLGNTEFMELIEDKTVTWAEMLADRSYAIADAMMVARVREGKALHG